MKGSYLPSSSFYTYISFTPLIRLWPTKSWRIRLTNPTGSQSLLVAFCPCNQEIS